jgi:hypothetical protein
MTPPPPITRSGAQRAAQRELSKSIYHHNGEPWPVRAVRAFGRLIDHVLNRAVKSAPSGSGGALAIVVLVAVVVAFVIWRSGAPRRAAKPGAVMPIGRAMSAAEHRSMSEDAAGRADWRVAVVERMRAIAGELEERSVLDPRAGRTATEVAREAGQVVPAVTTELGVAAEIFNHVAYGNGQASPDDLDVMIATDSAVRQAARSKVLAQ